MIYLFNFQVISRTHKKARPTSCHSRGGAISGHREGFGGESGSESEGEMTSRRTTIDIDFGGVDITSNDGGWDTDLEMEGTIN